MKNILFLSILWFFFTSNAFSQNYDNKKFKKMSNEIDSLKELSKPGKSKFLLRGYSHSGIVITDENSSFVGGSFNPIFIYKQSDRLMFESELEFELEDRNLNIGLEYANISYLLTKSLTVRFGKILLPFGIFVDRMHPAWVDKFSSKPLGVGHGGILPSSDIGIEIRGASYLGVTKINYSLYVMNGPRLNEGDEEPDEAGQLHYDNYPDNNRNKVIGGRLGFLPLSNSSLEIGFSGMYGKVGSTDSDYAGVASKLFAIDFSYIQNLPFMQSVLDVKAQYSGVITDNANYRNYDDLINPDAVYTFTNQNSTTFAQIALRPAMVNNKILRNFEIAGRYSDLITPEGSKWASNLNQWEFSLNYWLNWRMVFKLSYRTTEGETEHTEGAESPLGKAFFFHWAIGF